MEENGGGGASLVDRVRALDAHVKKLDELAVMVRLALSLKNSPTPRRPCRFAEECTNTTVLHHLKYLHKDDDPRQHELLSCQHVEAWDGPCSATQNEIVHYLLAGLFPKELTLPSEEGSDDDSSDSEDDEENNDNESSTSGELSTQPSTVFGIGDFLRNDFHFNANFACINMLDRLATDQTEQRYLSMVKIAEFLKTRVRNVLAHNAGLDDTTGSMFSSAAYRDACLGVCVSFTEGLLLYLLQVPSEDLTRLADIEHVTTLLKPLYQVGFYLQQQAGI
jgi:hypothetical protein